MVYSCGWLWCEEPDWSLFQSQDLTWALPGILLTYLASKYKLVHKTMDYLWSYPKGNSVRCEYKEKFFDMTYFGEELSSIFIKMKNGIRKPEDRQEQALVNDRCVGCSASPALSVCAHFPSPSIFLLFLCKSLLVLKISSPQIK